MLQLELCLQFYIKHHRCCLPEMFHLSSDLITVMSILTNQRKYNNNYNMYHVYVLTFKNCFRLTKANRAHDVDHFLKHMISKNWVDQNRFFSIILYSATNFIQFHEYFYIFANQRKYFTRLSGFLTSYNNFENDFTINCQQSFFYTSCWLTVIIHILKHKIFERNENPGNYWFYFLYINGVFKHVPFAGLWSLSPGSDTCPTERSADPEWSCTASGFPLLSHWGKKTYRQNSITSKSHWSGISCFLQLCLSRPN